MDLDRAKHGQQIQSQVCILYFHLGHPVSYFLPISWEYSIDITVTFDVC